MNEPGADHHSEKEFIEAVRENEPAATSEIANAVGVTRQCADERLRTLEGGGIVTSKKIGNSLAWFLLEDEDEHHAVDPTDEFWTAETYDGEARRVSEIDDTIYR